MELIPKKFQLDALNRLERFFSDSVLFADPSLAFARNVEPDRHLTTEYTPLPGMEHAPSVCLRVPTGGGKTMLAAMCIRRVANAMGIDAPVVLWLTPGKDIRQQTLNALQNPDHPYRRALWKDWGDRVNVYDIAEFARITPQDIRDKLSIVICTRQALQVNNTEGRLIYADNENLASHFTPSTLAIPGLELTDESGPFRGRPRYSFVNLLKVHRPLVIVDEAHQFVTPLAQEIRQRIGSHALVEFTATPTVPSNVLLSVSATQLREDKLIKLPVVLAEHTGVWQNAVTEAVATRRTLAQFAVEEPDYIRPILLIQAQNEGQSGDWRAVKAHLLESDHLSPNEIAVHTGQVRELEGVDLFQRDCPVTTIITVQALREGWDCSFAYVLCSTANIGNAGDVEQWLGRILRMPYARERKNQELQRAYVHAATERFMSTVEAVKQSLQDMGFEEYEARAAIQNRQGDLPLFHEPFRLTLSQSPDTETLPRAEAATLTVEPSALGQVSLTVDGPVTTAIAAAVMAQIPASQQADVVERIREHNRQWEPSPAQRGIAFSVPQLTVETETGDRLPFTDEILDEFVVTDLREYPEGLRHFRYDEATRRYLVDLSEEHLNLNLLGELAVDFSTYNMLAMTPSRAALAAELVPKLRQPWLNDRALDAWVLHALEAREDAGQSLELLYRARFVLLRLLKDSLANVRSVTRKSAFQELLFGSQTSALTTDEFSFRYPAQYLPNRFCPSTTFRKHFYHRAGDLEDRGDEYRCAVEIDQLQEVKHWVRNLAGKQHQHDSFWLQTWSDRFYPDFVAELEDGRILVVEYKGPHLAETPEELHKKELGELWAARSGGRGLFLWAVERDRHGRGVREQLRVIVS